MLLVCEACQVRFPPRRTMWFTPCPCCGAKLESQKAEHEPKLAGPLRLAMRSQPLPWLPAWFAFVDRAPFRWGLILAMFASTFVPFGKRALIAVDGALLVALAISVLRWLARRTNVLEVGAGRIASRWRLAPWPASWIPAGAIEKLELRPGVGLETSKIVATLRGTGMSVVLVTSPIPQNDGPMDELRERLESVLAEPAPEVPPEVQLTTGERSATLAWSCEQPVRLEVTAESIRAQVGGCALELDTDGIESAQVQALPAAPNDPQRFRLVLGHRGGKQTTLIDADLVEGALRLAARELVRVLRLRPGAALPEPAAEPLEEPRASVPIATQ